MTEVHPCPGYSFQQDNAPCHKSKIVSYWLMEQRNVLPLLEWPPLNPMEDFLGGVERENQMLHVHRNVSSFRENILKSWVQVSSTLLRYC